MKKTYTSTHMFLSFQKFITSNIHFHTHISRILKHESTYLNSHVLLNLENFRRGGILFVLKVPSWDLRYHIEEIDKNWSPPTQFFSIPQILTHKHFKNSRNVKVQIENIRQSWIPRFQIFTSRIIHMCTFYMNLHPPTHVQLKNSDNKCLGYNAFECHANFHINWRLFSN